MSRQSLPYGFVWAVTHPVLICRRHCLLTTRGQQFRLSVPPISQCTSASFSPFIPLLGSAPSPSAEILLSSTRCSHLHIHSLPLFHAGRTLSFSVNMILFSSHFFCLDTLEDMLCICLRRRFPAVVTIKWNQRDVELEWFYCDSPRPRRARYTSAGCVRRF